MNTSEVPATSSIGACWPPQPTTQERVRGFYTDGVLDIRNSSNLDNFEEAYLAAREQLGVDGISRISLRAIATVGAIRALEQDGIPVEAAMPFGRTVHDTAEVRLYSPEDAEAQLHVVYVGENSLMRRSHHQWNSPNHIPERVLTDKDQLRWPSGTVPPVAFECIAGAASEQQLGLQDQFAELLEPFGYNADEIVELLLDPAIHIVFAQTPEGRVVGSAMAELGQLDIGGIRTVNLAEITEASTAPDFRRRGIYRRASGLLLCHLGGLSLRKERMLERGLHVVFGECNLNMPAVLHAAARNGRYPVSRLVEVFYGKDLFGDAVRREQGRQPFGVLEQNFRVNDGTDSLERYNDFMLTWLSYGGHVGIRYAGR